MTEKPGRNTAHAGLRSEVLAAATAEMKRIGPMGFKISNVIDPFRDRGASEATLYRWVGKAVQSGLLGRVIDGQLKEASARRTAANLGGAGPAPDEIAELLPRLTSIDELGGVETLKVIDQIQKCIETALAVMDHSKDANGRPRQAKLLLAASEHLRKSAETITRIADRVHEYRKVEQFHAAAIEEIRKESPLCAERVLLRLMQNRENWERL